MGVELMSVKELLQAQLRRNGGALPPAPDGPYLEAFNAFDLAQAIEHEINRAQSQGNQKIRIDLTFDDAQKLASTLRRAVLLGA